MTDTIPTTRPRPDSPVSVRGHGPSPGRLLGWSRGIGPGRLTCRSRWTFAGRVLRWIAYDARLVVLGVQTMADAVTGENRTESWRLKQLDRQVHELRVGSSAELGLVVAGGLGRSVRVGGDDVRAGDRVVGAGVDGEDRDELRRVAEVVRGRGVEVVRPGGGGLFGFGLVSSVLGVVSWFLAVLLVMAVVRGAFYGFVEDGPLGAGTWGGPTMAGAWAVHAAVSVPIIAGLLFVFRGIGWLHGALVRRLYGLAGEWVLLATISVCAGCLWLMWSWIQQL